jgi:hypothetical protein
MLLISLIALTAPALSYFVVRCSPVKCTTSRKEGIRIRTARDLTYAILMY